MRTATNTSPRGLALRWHSRGRRGLLPRRGRPALLVAVGVLAVGVLAFNLLWAPPAVARNASAPDRPSRPTATSVSHDSVTISWTGVSNSDITGYQILRRNRDTDARGAFTVIDEDADSLGTTYTDDTVSPSTRYAYRVRARNAHGLSRASRSARIETPAAAEPVPAKHDDGDTYLRGHQDPPWTGHTVDTIARTVSHSINSPGGELWYTLPSLEADRVYHFFPLTNSIGNTKFEIYDNTGAIVVQKGHEVAGQAFRWTDRGGGVINRSLRLYFIPETDGTYHLRVYSTQNKTGTITLRYQDVTLASSRGDSSGEDCNSNVFFVNCQLHAGEVVSGKIHVDDGTSSRWNVGLDRGSKAMSPTPNVTEPVSNVLLRTRHVQGVSPEGLYLRYMRDHGWRRPLFAALHQRPRYLRKEHHSQRWRHLVPEVHAGVDRVVLLPSQQPQPDERDDSSSNGYINWHLHHHLHLELVAVEASESGEVSTGFSGCAHTGRGRSGTTVTH